MQMTDEQLKLITTKLSTIKDCSPFYAEKFKDIDPTDVRTQEDFEKLLGKRRPSPRVSAWASGGSR